MTPRQRVLAVLRGRRPDKVPFTIYENKIPQCAVERRLRNEGLCIVNRRHRAWREETPNCTWETHHYAKGSRPRVRTVVRTPVGEVSSVAEPAAFTSWTLERFFKGPEDYKVLRFMEADRLYVRDYDAYLQAERWMGEDVILRSGVGACPLHRIMIQWMGLETFAVEWCERRDEILRLESTMRQKLRGLYPILADAPITHANFGGNEVTGVMGPQRYREFCIPLYDECAEVLHAKGKLLGTHLDGNNRLWAGAVAACALDYVEAFTPAPDTDMSLDDALAAWPDKVLWINFPSSLHLASIERIRQSARQIVAAARGTGRVILGITEDIPPDRWQENLLAISGVIREA
jgi:hypothetical protein